MDLSRANGNFQASALSSLNGASSNTTGNNNESVPSLIGAESVLPSREAFARPRRLPTTETAQILSPGMIPPTAMSLREGTTSARTSASSRIPTPIGTSYITDRQLHLQWQPRQVYQERTTPGSYGALDPNVNSSGMPIQPSLRSEISDQSTPPPPPASVPRRAMPMHRPPIRSSGVTERDQVRHDTPSGHATTTTSSLLDWNSPMSIPVSPMSRPERSDHEQRHRLFQQRLNDEAQQFDARREPPLSGEFVARPSSPPWITANPLPPATVPSAPNMHPAIQPGVIVVPGTFPVVPFHMHTNAMRGATQTSENHPWISSANRTASQPADAGSTFWEHLVGPLPGTPISDTSVAAVSPNPLSARPNVVASNPPVSGTSNVYLTNSNTQLHYEEASDPDNIPTTINEPGTIRNTNSRREMGTQFALSIPGTTSSDSTNILRSPLGDVARSAPARALFLFELISAILDATSSLTSAASTSSSNSSLNQIGEQPSAGAMTSSPRSSSVAGFFAQYLTAAIAASHIANVEQEHYAGHGSGNSLTTLGGGGAHLNRGQDHVVVTRSHSRRRDGLSSAVLGYRVGDGPHSTSELGTYREANDGSSPNEPQTRGRFAGSWGNRLNRDGDGDGDDWDLEDDDDLRLFYASHATPESLIDDYEENWGSWGGADRSGPPSESRFPSFGPARQQVIENGRGEESQNDDHHHHYLYRYQDTTRPLLSRRNRVRGGLLPGSLLRSPGVNERDTSGRALPLLPLHSPFSDGSVPRRSTIEILDANGILIDAHIPSNPSLSDLYGDGPESSLGLFRNVHPLTRGGLAMSAPLRSEGGLSLGDDRIERRGRQRNHVAGPHTEGSIFHTGVERRHPAKCFESECTDTSESPCFPFDVACERQAAAVPLFYRLSHFENSQGRAVRRETRVTAQYYTYWHPNTV